MQNLSLPQKPIRRSVSLPPDFWKAAAELGSGNATLGLKRALAIISARPEWKGTLISIANGS